jgi:disulfide bond formation protein DsbB
MIRECILAGGVIYVIIAIIQVVQRPSLAFEGIAVAIGLALATAFYLTRREHELHSWEAVAFWASVLLFAAYGILKFRGVV